VNACVERITASVAGALSVAVVLIVTLDDATTALLRGDL
jgi:hypothetical protein